MKHALFLASTGITLLGFTALYTGCSSSGDDSGSKNQNGGSAGTSGSAGMSAAAGMSAGGSAGSGTGGSGGTSGAGGSTGGSAGTGTGGASMGGSAGSGTQGGSAGMPAGGAGAAGGTAPVGSCTFTITQTLSDKISAVAIVEWSVDRPQLDSASIQFGLDTTYQYTAPVDLAEPMYRTILVGMKTEHDYHYRVVAKAGSETCMSEDKVLHTGPVPNGMGMPTIETPQPDKVTGGFLVTERWGMNNDGPAFILDADGDIVWWYPGDVDIIRTRLDLTGKKMWIRNTAQTNGTGIIKRVTLDGMKEEKWSLPNTTHDLAVLPDGHVALIGHVQGDCDEILDFNPETEELKSVINAKEVTGSTMCHLNYVSYYDGDKSLLFSDWQSSTIAKITRTGEVIWVANGDMATLTGPTNWVHQHAVQSLSADEILVFSNGDAGQRSIVYDMKIDLGGKTITENWTYDGGQTVMFGGDVQRLDNGNYIITYSAAGVVHELDSERKLVQSLSFTAGNTLAYSEKLKTLYDAPPPRIY
ncbi:MAG TPA: aryl-sulfate sulfotransferase [Polyangiaceae bacterium]|nr:aryl-sulfate sulfotransferase [Polyangiaceae bacterium]